MKKIIFCFQQVGGANALLPLIEKWKPVYDIFITGSKFVCDYLRNRGMEEVCDYNELGLRPGIADTDSRWFEKLLPDIVITDTIDLMRTPDGIACRDFWLLAEKYRVPSVTYVDCWWGYDKRFLLPGETSPPILPGFIAVVDDYAKKDIISAGFPVGKIVVPGSPRFELLSKAAFFDNETQKAGIKKKNGLERDDFIILFVSQPLEKVFGSSDLYGFTEVTTLSAMLNVLVQFPRNLKKKLSVIVLLHPEEDESILRTVVNKKKSKDISVIFRKEDNPLKLVLTADLVVGMFSILLAEAVIMNRPVLSIQLGLKREEILITNIIGATLSINNYEQLSSELFQCVTNEKHRTTLVKRQKKFDVVTDAGLRWDSMIRGILYPDYSS